MKRVAMSALVLRKSALSLVLATLPSCRLPGRHTPGNMTRKQQKPLILALTK